MKRKEAISRGLYRYTAEHPCKRGHAPLRYSNTGACVACMSTYAARNRTLQKANLERLKAQRKIVSYNIHVDDEARLVAFVQALALTRDLKKA